MQPDYHAFASALKNPSIKILGPFSGWRGIRTPGRVTPTPVFKTGAFDQTQPSIRCFVAQFVWARGKFIKNRGPDKAISTTDFSF